MKPSWIGNARIPPVTMQDLSDREWFLSLKEKHGDRIHIGPPREAAGHSADYWDNRGMVGLYLEDNDAKH